jgi:hypothetical protein
MLMMLPPDLLSHICLATTCATRHAPFRLTWITLRHSSSPCSRNGCVVAMPALFTRTFVLNAQGIECGKHRVARFRNPKLLELELTESVSIEDPENTIQILRTLKGMGVGLSIDDFGT